MNDADLDAARLLLARMGITPEQLLRTQRTCPFTGPVELGGHGESIFVGCHDRWRRVGLDLESLIVDYLVCVRARAAVALI